MHRYSIASLPYSVGGKRANDFRTRLPQRRRQQQQQHRQQQQKQRQQNPSQRRRQHHQQQQQQRQQHEQRRSQPVSQSPRRPASPTPIQSVK